MSSIPSKFIYITKFQDIFEEINHGIHAFNELLATDFKIPSLDPDDSKSCTVIANIPWDDQVWPDGDWPGVYLLCGCQENNPEIRGIYIGKSSLGKIGDRIWAHLNPHRSTEIYRMNDMSGESFIFEVIISIALQDPRMRSLASALEEHIIFAVRDNVHLLNGTGNVR